MRSCSNGLVLSTRESRTSFASSMATNSLGHHATSLSRFGSWICRRRKPNNGAMAAAPHRRQGDRTVMRAKWNGRLNHNFIPFYFQLHWLPLSNGNIEIAHHDKDMVEGEIILWGESFEEASFYLIVRTSRPVDLTDLWYAECRLLKPDIYVAGTRI